MINLFDKCLIIFYKSFSKILKIIKNNLRYIYNKKNRFYFNFEMKLFYFIILPKY